jgi:hypothetical protein
MISILQSFSAVFHKPRILSSSAAMANETNNRKVDNTAEIVFFILSIILLSWQDLYLTEEDVISSNRNDIAQPLPLFWITFAIL